VALAISPDGRTLAAGTGDRTNRTIRLWDLPTGKELVRIPVERGVIIGVCFSPDGKTLAGTTDVPSKGRYMAQLWDAATGKELRSWALAHPGPLVFSPDRRTLAGGENGGPLLSENWGSEFWDPRLRKERTLRLWDSTGKEHAFPTGQLSSMASAAFSPDGRMLAWGNGDGTVCLWEVAAGKVRRRLAGHRAAVYALAFSPDGKSLASGSHDSTAVVWDVTGLLPGDRRRAGALSPAQRKKLWADLAGDPARAFRAVGTLAASPREAVTLLAGRLAPAAAPGRSEGPTAPPEALRSLRALEVLERVGTPGARRLLEKLSRGAPGARLTREARTSLERLAKRPQS
jgi:hypothetical protein